MMKNALELLLAVILAAMFMPAAKAARGRQLLQAQPTEFALPALPYAYNAIEPAIDNQTMYLHHTAVHLAALRVLNGIIAGQAAAGNNMYGMTLSKLCRSVGKKKNGLNVSAAVEGNIRSNACSAWNHAMYWRMLTPPGSPDRKLPSNTSKFGKELIEAFGPGGSYELINLDDGLLGAAGSGLIGVGWVWVVADDSDDTDHPHLKVVTTNNYDNPLNIYGSKDAPLFPILAIDVWEHAYWTKYSNRRNLYLTAWFDIINWTQVEANYNAIKKRDYNTLIGADANIPKPKAATPPASG